MSHPFSSAPDRALRPVTGTTTVPGVTWGEAMNTRAIVPEAELIGLFEAQRAAVRPGDGPSLAVRRDALERLRAVIVGGRLRFAAAISADFGVRSQVETDLLEIAPALSAVCHAHKRLARWMKPVRRPVDLTFQPARAWVRHQPLGVIGVVSPWNYPLLLALGPLVDALAAGNRVMLKPSELTPAFAELLRTELATRFDADEVAVVTGGPETAAAFTQLPFDHLLFTGSTAVGRKVMAAAAQNLTPVTLELGGKSPTLVLPGADVAKAARSIAFGKFVNAGQTCIAPDYVLAPRREAQALAEAVLARARASYPEPADDPEYSGVIDVRHHARLSAAVEEARAGGARVLSYGRQGGRKLGPTVVLDAPQSSTLMRDEIFGPVLPIVAYDTVDEAIAFVNAREKPLAMYVLGGSAREREAVLARTTSGGATLNGTLLHIAQESLPFGGVGPSGTGAYHGYEGFRRFSHARGVHAVGPFNGMEMLGPPWGALARRMAARLVAAETGGRGTTLPAGSGRRDRRSTGRGQAGNA